MAFIGLPIPKPFECIVDFKGNVTAGSLAGSHILKEAISVVRMSALFDDDFGTFIRPHYTNIGCTLFCHDQVDVVFGVIDVGDERHNTRDVAVFRH